MRFQCLYGLTLCVKRHEAAGAARQQDKDRKHGQGKKAAFHGSPHCTSVNAAAAPLQCRVGLNVQSQVAFHCSRDGAEAMPPRAENYFLAAMRFFFFAGSFGRDLPNEPW